MRRVDSSTKPQTEYASTGEELQEVASGQNPATPAWTLVFVILAVSVLFTIALTLAALAYFFA